MSYKARIKFDDKEWLVIDNFKVGDIKYYYIIEDVSNEIEKAGGIENYDKSIDIEFIHDIGNGIYNNVVDPELKSQLLAIVALRKLNEEEAEEEE